MEGMPMRKLVSISCLLLLCTSWAASAQAQQTIQVAVPAVVDSGTTMVPATKLDPGSVVDIGTTVNFGKSLNSAEPAVAPVSAPKVDFKVDLTGAPLPVLNSDELAAQRALRQYDESMRNWSLPPESLNGILADSRVGEPQDKFRLNRRDEFLANSRSAQDFDWQRQRTADRIADSIYPGFGRIETTYANGASSRLDYIYTKRCGGRSGWGVCWQYRF